VKELIKKILREQVEEDLGGIPQVKDDSMRRIRIVLSQMKSHKGWKEYLYAINEEKKEPSGHQELKQTLDNILKLMGGVVHVSNFERAYWFAKVFDINGGYGRDFKEGGIQVIEIPQYEMEGEYTEEVFDFRTGWGTVVGVDDEDEAIRYFDSDITAYMQDSESSDSDYGEVYDVENVIVQNVGWIKFIPEWVGL